MASYFRTQLEDWLKGLEVRADRVLDVGGGALPVKDRVKLWNVGEYKILDNELEDQKQKPDFVCDLNKSYDRFVGHNGLYIDCPGCGGDEIVGVDKLPIIKGDGDCYNFDIIFCLEVMEYILDPRTAINNLKFMLKDKGILYISFPFVYPHHNPAGHDFLRYTRWGVIKLLTETGFEIDEIRARTQKVEIDYNQDPPQNSQQDIKGWYSDQKMHPVKSGIDHNEIGYIVKAIKK